MRAFDVRAGGHRLEAEWHGPPPTDAPTLVLLHEGLGSVSLWRDWPARLAAESGLGVFVYSRQGYGASDPITPPRPLSYMHDEGRDIVPQVLDAASITRAILVGHSDGASIALVHAATTIAPARIRGLALLAPHVFCEDLSVASIAEAREAYLHGDLRARLARHHRDVDGAFWGWNRAWLDPDFRRWNLEQYLPTITCPTLVIQGTDDPYGTLAQVDAIERGVSGPFARLILPSCGHSPHRDQSERATNTIVSFAHTI